MIALSYPSILKSLHAFKKSKNTEIPVLMLMHVLHLSTTINLDKIDHLLFTGKAVLPIKRDRLRMIWDSIVAKMVWRVYRDGLCVYECSVDADESMRARLLIISEDSIDFDEDFEKSVNFGGLEESLVNDFKNDYSFNINIQNSNNENNLIDKNNIFNYNIEDNPIENNLIENKSNYYNDDNNIDNKSYNKGENVIENTNVNNNGIKDKTLISKHVHLRSESLSDKRKSKDRITKIKSEDEKENINLNKSTKLLISQYNINKNSLITKSKEDLFTTGELSYLDRKLNGLELCNDSNYKIIEEKGNKSIKKSLISSKSVTGRKRGIYLLEIKDASEIDKNMLIDFEIEKNRILDSYKKEKINARNLSRKSKILDQEAVENCKKEHKAKIMENKQVLESLKNNNEFKEIDDLGENKCLNNSKPRKKYKKHVVKSMHNIENYKTDDENNILNKDDAFIEQLKLKGEKIKSSRKKNRKELLEIEKNKGDAIIMHSNDKQLKDKEKPVGRKIKKNLEICANTSDCDENVSITNKRLLKENYNNEIKDIYNKNSVEDNEITNIVNNNTAIPRDYISEDEEKQNTNIKRKQARGNDNKHINSQEIKRKRICSGGNKETENIELKIGVEELIDARNNTIAIEKLKKPVKNKKISNFLSLTESFNIQAIKPPEIKHDPKLRFQPTQKEYDYVFKYKDKRFQKMFTIRKRGNIINPVKLTYVKLHDRMHPPFYGIVEKANERITHKKISLVKDYEHDSDEDWIYEEGDSIDGSESESEDSSESENINEEWIERDSEACETGNVYKKPVLEIFECLWCNKEQENSDNEMLVKSNEIYVFDKQAKNIDKFSGETTNTKDCMSYECTVKQNVEMAENINSLDEFAYEIFDNSKIKLNQNTFTVENMHENDKANKHKIGNAASNEAENIIQTNNDFLPADSLADCNKKPSMRNGRVFNEKTTDDISMENKGIIFSTKKINFVKFKEFSNDHLNISLIKKNEFPDSLVNALKEDLITSKSAEELSRSFGLRHMILKNVVLKTIKEIKSVQ